MRVSARYLQPSPPRGANPFLPPCTRTCLTFTPKSGGVFKLELFLTDDYPMVPPKIRFLTKIYHPNVDKLGRICLDVLKSK